jgi:hypothetical protein
MSLDPVKDAWEEYHLKMREVNDAIDQIQACQSIIITALHDLGDNVREAKESCMNLPGPTVN